jgi:type I restriction enzyme S subunit
VKPNPKKILPVFLLGMMQSTMFREQVEQQVRGVAQKTLNLGELQEIKIFVPPLSLQEEFAGVVRRVESLRGRMGESTRQVEGLFESLLAEVFS